VHVLYPKEIEPNIKVKTIDELLSRCEVRSLSSLPCSWMTLAVEDKIIALKQPA